MLTDLILKSSELLDIIHPAQTKNRTKIANIIIQKKKSLKNEMKKMQ